MLNHEYFMQQVLNLARLTHAQALPNPQVAALIVKNDQILGSGTHLFAGSHHAEIHALNQAGDKAHGATLYVNLEPCAHYGRTPPCTNAIIKAGISQVFIANLDPNPLVSGQGVNKLREAGIIVEVGLCADEAAAINQVFFHTIQTKWPYVTLKAGLSLDGRIATKGNLSRWITNQEARADAHQYRVSHDAILVGVNTVLSDDPSLTAHLLDNPTRNPIRIVLDHNLRTPLSAKLVQDQQAPTWICTTNPDTKCHEPYQQHGVRILYFTELTINKLLDQLYQDKIYTLLVEGGEQVYTSFIEARAVNQIITYYSPQLIGSKEAKHLFAGAGFSDLVSNLKFEIVELKQLGNNVKIVSQLIKGL